MLNKRTWYFTFSDLIGSLSCLEFPFSAYGHSNAYLSFSAIVYNLKKERKKKNQLSTSTSWSHAPLNGALVRVNFIILMKEMRTKTLKTWTISNVKFANKFQTGLFQTEFDRQSLTSKPFKEGDMRTCGVEVFLMR